MSCLTNPIINPLRRRYEVSEFKGVIVDGANILTKTSKQNESVVVIPRLTKLVSIVEALGWQILIGLKNDSYYWMIKRST